MVKYLRDKFGKLLPPLCNNHMLSKTTKSTTKNPARQENQKIQDAWLSIDGQGFMTNDKGCDLPAFCVL
jgi:hypothetical protein